MDNSKTWSRSKFSKYLQNEMKLNITTSTLRKYEMEDGLLFPEVLEKNNTSRSYSEKDIPEVLKINVLNENLGIKLKDIRRIEGIDIKRIRHTKRGTPKPVYERNKQMDPEHLLELLHKPELRLPVDRSIVFDKIVFEINECRSRYIEEWYSHMDWHALYNLCKANQEMKEPLKLANFEQLIDVESIISKLDIRKLIDETSEELKDELYYDAAEEIEELYDLDEYDEDTADPDIIEAFEQELEERVMQYEEETVLEKMEQFVDEEVVKVIQELSSNHIHDDVHYIFPELKEAISEKLNMNYRDIRKNNVKVFQEAYETQQLILNPVDMQLIAVLFYGDFSFYMIAEHPLYIEFIDKHYRSIKACSKHLVETYVEQMGSRLPMLPLIPGGVNTILEEVRANFPTIPIYYETINI
ncbi:DNA-binding transcriptional MerR regulator [Fontibacillus solani]|uniref:DNA-binding transcriptional MerR regulator n=1 Tax=Fontibacillus solani TaxID=1572857 RepID=A0A7W3SW44_9BACL|nr:MerR family transcriptional regulator [Fontibacillus solani]MBA9087279.1 DNA-binding transcriptional MerR regulator [Fontibacillus solani]